MPRSRSDSMCRAPSPASWTSPQSPGEEVAMSTQTYTNSEINDGEWIMWAGGGGGGGGEGPDFCSTEGHLHSPSLSLPSLLPYVQSLGTHEHTFGRSMKSFIWIPSRGLLSHSHTHTHLHYIRDLRLNITLWWAPSPLLHSSFSPPLHQLALVNTPSCPINNN